jgi:hypothetical protein
MGRQRKIQYDRGIVKIEEDTMEDRVLKLLEGAWDTHLHSDPGILKYRNSILELGDVAKSLGMGGIVFKDINISTAAQVSIVQKVIPDIKVVGGVTLSACTGGTNPFAVEASFKMGGKVIWMYALDSKFMVTKMFEPGYPLPMEHNRNILVPLDLGGYSIFKEGTEELIPEAKEIVALCKQYDGVLETSHLSPAEAFAMVREAKAQGVKKIVLTHVNSPLTPYDLDQQKAFIEMGAVVNFCMVNYYAKISAGSQTLKELAQAIRDVGVENVTIGSDVGTSFWPAPTECIHLAVAGLAAQGFTDEEISLIIRDTPERIYGS